VSVRDADKPFILEAVRLLSQAGFTIIATGGTCAYLQAQGLQVEPIKKVLEGRPNILDRMKNGEVHIVFNTTEGMQSLQDSFSIRRSALMMKIPYYTTAAGAQAAAQAIATAPEGALEVRALQSYA
jgi:carbamoyl-phosphate synthase large subunit